MSLPIGLKRHISKTRKNSNTGSQDMTVFILSYRHNLIGKGKSTLLYFLVPIKKDLLVTSLIVVCCPLRAGRNSRI